MECLHVLLLFSFLLLSSAGYDGTKSDIWAAGVVLFIMIASFPPFQKVGPSTTLVIGPRERYRRLVT